MLPPLALSSGPASDTAAAAAGSVAGAPTPMSATRKKLPPDCASLPTTIALLSWIKGDVVVDVNCAPCSMEKPAQQAAAEAATPRLVWLNVPLLADIRGPASASDDGVPATVPRRVRMLPAVSIELPRNAMNGDVLVLVTCAPFPMKRNEKVLAVGSPVWKSVDMALSHGPA